ncbi:MAG: mediator of RNA polymerase II transcription subunit 13 [Thelocarpon impressellum]|nr:MAG: mediator of RNA polymerase II transcription subunit 13 [Thelocarpon impressellum]
MDLWTGEPDEGADGRRKASGASAFDLPSAGLDDGDGGNMFGEMDEEMFNETGVTEADFSFFDQPGDDDMFGADVDTAKCTDGVAQMEEVAQSLRDAGQKLEDGATSTEVVIPKSEFARDDLRQEETQSRSGEDGDPEGVSVKRERSPTNSVALSRPSTLREPHGGVLVISPPFSPEQVLKRILPAAPSTARDEQPADSSEGRPAVKQTGEWTQTSGNFEPVVFNTTLDVATHKYDSGHFWFSGPQNVSSIPAQSSNLAVIPRIGLPKESREPRRHLPHEAGKGLDDEHAAVFPKARSGRSGSETDEEGREGESSDQADDTSDTSDEETAPVGASHGMKRKRAIEDDGDAMASSMKLLAVHQSADAPLAQTEAGPSLEELGPDPADWLGNHVSGEVKDYVGGLVPVDIHSPDPGGATVQEIMTAIRRTCMGLGNLLPTLPDLLQNVVIYIIDPFSHSGGLVDLCMAFGALFHTYVQSPKIQQSKKVNEIVLQIVPIDFIAAKDAVVVPTQAQYTRLALEVYERCALTQGQTIDTFPSSSLALRGTAPALPDALDLDAAAAATDMTPVSTPAPNTQSPEQSATPAHNAATPANAPTPTPAANPGTPGTTADATAASENDAEAILVDPTDDTWMVTLSHRLHNSPDTTDYRPSLASGYLVKRAGAHDDMPPAVLGVKILHALPPASPAQGLQRGPFDPLLREILGAYRDLSSLAWLKGVVLSDAGHRSGVGEVVPWHVAAAIKAQEALSYLM